MSEPDRTKLPIRRPPFGRVCNKTLAADRGRDVTRRLGLNGLDVRISLVPASYEPLPG